MNTHLSRVHIIEVLTLAFWVEVTRMEPERITTLNCWNFFIETIGDDGKDYYLITEESFGEAMKELKKAWLEENEIEQWSSVEIMSEQLQGLLELLKKMGVNAGLIYHGTTEVFVMQAAMSLEEN